VDQLKLLSQLMSYVALRIDLHNPDTRRYTMQEIDRNCPPPMKPKFKTFDQMVTWCDHQIWNRLLVYKALRGEKDFQYCVSFLRSIDFICEDVSNSRINMPEVKEALKRLLESKDGRIY
jgi:hypothetical protein